MSQHIARDDSFRIDFKLLLMAASGSIADLQLLAGNARKLAFPPAPAERHLHSRDTGHPVRDRSHRPLFLDEPRPAFGTFGPERQMGAAILLPPEARPEAVITPHPLVILEIPERGVAASMARDVEHQDRGNEEDQSHGGRPEIAERPTDEAAQGEKAAPDGGGPLPPTRHGIALRDRGVFCIHAIVVAALGRIHQGA